MVTRERKKNGKLLALTVVALAALVIGLILQMGLGFWRYRQSREAAGAALAAIIRDGERQAQTLRGEVFTLAEDAQAGAEGPLRELAKSKGETQRAKHLELLMLVNPWHTLPDGYVPELAPAVSMYQAETEYVVDARCADELSQMLNDCLMSGNIPLICSAYRTQDYQQMLFDNKISRLIDEGVSPEDAPAEAATAVALPGTSEHQLGLAVDLIDEYYPYLNEAQEWTDTQIWLMEHCWDYGFILRYPNGTSDITGIIYEPWHYRYVGLEHAKAIHELGVTLEEYVQLRNGR